MPVAARAEFGANSETLGDGVRAVSGRNFQKSARYKVTVSKFVKDGVSKYVGLECQNMSNIGCQILITSNIGGPKIIN